MEPMLYAAVPLGLSALGWGVIKIIQHDTWLKDVRAAIQRIEDKLDRLMES